MAGQILSERGAREEFLSPSLPFLILQAGEVTIRPSQRLLAAIGIYGVMSFAVAQRTHEIGLRMALGAGPQQVLRLVLKEGMLLALIGLAVGLGGTYFVGRLMKTVSYQVNAIDPAAISAVAAVLLLSALLACYIPARRATQVDPMVALRDE